MFQRKNIKKSRIRSKYTKTSSKTVKKPWKKIFKVCLYLFIFFVVSWFILSLVLYKKYLSDLPSVQEMEKLEFAEASTIYDKNWIELYKIFKEKRTYVNYEEINKNMINALVAWEDKRFWENPWVDFIWLARAWINYLTWNESGIKGTSTLTQQLIRNTIITNERSIERKIKEMYLAIQLTNWVAKEKILELYLNKIEFWSNAFGIEQAAKTFFDTSASELNILESSMLASLPKTPTGLSPYNYPKRLIWYPYIFSEENEDSHIEIVTQKDKTVHTQMITKLTDYISAMKGKPLKDSNKILICNLDEELFKINQRIDGQWCSIQEYSHLLNMLNAIQINNEWNIIEYQTWRKDFILWRMLEDGYITFDEYKQSVIDGIWYKFNKSKENIKAPHFVFYVKEYLEEKYWAEVIAKWGLKIYTTLDYELQQKAEEIVEKQTEINATKFNAKNAAVVTLDNKDGSILVMVGSKDYFDEENKWNVNVITSKLQPWSTFKPFVYSIATYKNEIWSHTPMYDVETQFPWYKPQNFDGKFKGLMNFSTALNESRNIPAIKMFFLAWWEKAIVNFMKNIWADSLKEHGQYGAPLALGTWEMTPLELAKSYWVFASMWIKKEITPIIKIEDSKWNIILEKEDTKWDQVISKGQTYLINNVLSNSSTRPEFWNNYLTISGRKAAAKTGTSTKQTERWGEKIIYPANLWTAWYTPQYTTVAWAWNTDWEKLNFKWNGLEWAWPIWKNTMEIIHKSVPAENWKKPNEVKEINISEVSWFLPSPENTNNNFIVKSLFLNKPSKYDYSFKTIQVDALCNWLITHKTPEAAKQEVTLVQFNSLLPGNSSWENPVQEWVKSWEAAKKYWNLKNITTNFSEQECERSDVKSEININSLTNKWDVFTVWLNNIKFAYRSSNPIIKIDVMLENKVVDSIAVDNKLEWIYEWVISLPFEYENKKIDITFRAVDDQYYSKSDTTQIYILWKDVIKPEINISNPSDLSISLYNDWFFNLRWKVEDRSPIRTINVYIDDTKYKIWLTWPEFVVPISAEWLDYGLHTIRVDAIDYWLNKSSKLIKLEILQK